MEHAIIPDAQRHEPKGASTATTGSVLKSQGDGTTVFSAPTYAELTGKPTVTGFTRVLSGSSIASSQAPSATNTALQIEFGAGTTTTNATLNSAGLLTFNVAGTYQVTVIYRLGRTTGAGVAVLFTRALISGAQTLNSNSVMLDNASTIVPFAVTLNITATAGMTMQHQIYRDSAGINNGGLIAQTPALAGWNVSPTATIIVDKFVGISA